MTELETDVETKQRVHRRQALDQLTQLRLTEDKILEKLTLPQYDDELIAREELIKQLIQSKTISKRIGRALKHVNKAMEEHAEASRLYKGISIRAARYFFVASALTKLNSMYIFTHEWFFVFFNKQFQAYKKSIRLDESMDKAEKVRWLQKEFTETFHCQVC